MKVGDLVITSPGTDYSELGIVTDITGPDKHQLGLHQRIIKVLQPTSGEELNWAESGLEKVIFEKKGR